MENIKNYLIKKIEILRKFSSTLILLKLEKIEEKIKSSLFEEQIRLANDQLESIELEIKAKLPAANYRELKKKLVLLDEQNENILKEFEYDYERIRNMMSNYNLFVIWGNVPYQRDRDGIELYLYNKFKPYCNEQTPPGTTAIPVGLWY